VVSLNLDHAVIGLGTLLLTNHLGYTCSDGQIRVEMGNWLRRWKMCRTCVGMWTGARPVWQHGRFNVERLDVTQRHRREDVVTVRDVVRRLCWSWNNWTGTRPWTRYRYLLGRRLGGNLSFHGTFPLCFISYVCM